MILPSSPLGGGLDTINHNLKGGYIMTKITTELSTGTWTISNGSGINNFRAVNDNYIVLWHVEVFKDGGIYTAMPHLLIDKNNGRTYVAWRYMYKMISTVQALGFELRKQNKISIYYDNMSQYKNAERHMGVIQ